MNDFVEWLARKWCPTHNGHAENVGTRFCACLELAAAVREALEEAMRETCPRCAGNWPVKDHDGERWHVAPNAGHILLPDGRCQATAIALLRGGTP